DASSPCPRSWASRRPSRRSGDYHVGTGEAGTAALDPALGAAHPTVGSGGTGGGGDGDGGRAHLPVAGRGDPGVAGVRPVPPGHLRAAAVPSGCPHDVRRVPSAPLHAVLELPGALPLLQRHLRGTRGGGAALRRHPQPRLPLPPRLLRPRGLLPGARALPARRGRDCPRCAAGLAGGGLGLQPPVRTAPLAPPDPFLPISSPGTPSQNTQCQPCPPGTFSASSSSSEQCQPHRNCTALGLVLNVPGSASHDALCTSCAGFPLGTPEPGGPGAEECERAVIDFVAFQDWSFKKLLRLWQALRGPEAQGLVPPREGRNGLQPKLRQQLLELREAQAGALAVRLLRALREARLPGLERSVRTRFWAR
uniref:TNFR-Cys domain-containing protein n=1 Tax=Lynx canadensis TaxID=61383 RepID=A0A667GLZ3_LYNCA